MHGVSLLRPAQRNQDQVDELDADERHDDAADAVDPAGCGAARRGADGAVAHARSASGMSAMMMSALKITAERIALCGVASP